MQLENNTQHPKYKQAVIVTGILLLIAVIMSVVVIMIVNNKQEQEQERRYQEKYQAELFDQVKEYFTNLPDQTKEQGEQGFKSAQEFFKNNPSQELGISYEEYASLKESQNQVFLEWKSTFNKQPL